jgi:hypothetical protein
VHARTQHQRQQQRSSRCGGAHRRWWWGGAGSAALRCSPQLLLAPSLSGAQIMPRQDKAQNSAELFSETCPSSLLLLRFQWRFAQQLAADGRPGPFVKRAHEARLPSLSLQACRV